MQANEAFKNFTVAKISLPLQGAGTAELDCVIHMAFPPEFEATFLPNQLPVHQLDSEKTCKVFYFMDGEGHLLNSRIKKTISGEKLLMEVKKNKVFHHVRDYFRIDAHGKVFYQAVSGGDTALREYEGVVNISGGGVRFPVRGKFSLHQKILLKISFEAPLEIEADCLGEVVRSRNFHQNNYIAVKFTEIEPRAREKIISFCIAIQREELRTKVKIADPF